MMGVVELRGDAISMDYGNQAAAAECGIPSDEFFDVQISRKKNLRDSQNVEGCKKRSALFDSVQFRKMLHVITYYFFSFLSF